MGAEESHTLLNAIFLGAALGVGSSGDALDALIKVVLGRRALLRVPAFCISNIRSSASDPTSVMVTPSSQPPPVVRPRHRES